jgi:hypothetical protein
MNVSDRLKVICENKKIKNIDLVELGCASQQTVSFVLNGKVKPNSQFLEIFLNAYKDVNARWLLTGEENMLLREDPVRYGFCKECLKKEGVIEHLKREISAKDKRIEELLLKGAEPPEGKVGQANSGKKAS